MTTAMEETPLSVAVLLGSVRRDRMGPRAAALVTRELERRGHAVHLVDPLELQLPLLDRMYKEHPAGEAPEPLERLARLYRSVDGFLIVSAEYNHGIPPALKNLLDHFLEEYFWRPSGIVCYSAGPFGGVRAAMQLQDDARRAWHAEHFEPAADPAHRQHARRGRPAGRGHHPTVDQPLPRRVHLACPRARGRPRRRDALLKRYARRIDTMTNHDFS